MSGAVAQFFDMIGVSLSTPTCFGDFVPWFFTVLIGFALVVAFFKLIFGLFNGMLHAGRWF